MCQCTISELVFSPDQKFALYIGDEIGKLSLLNTSAFSIKVLSTEYIGYPDRADWDLEQNQVKVYLRKWNEESKSHDRFEYKFQL